MEKRLTMILASLFLCVGMALAQTAVTGTVVSQEDGQPVIGATVRVAGTQTGTVTDADGRFSLSLPSGHNKLQVSYVGMETQEVTVRGRNVNVTLLPVRTDLDEVMVVAYGTSTKSAFTGSAAVIDAEEINKAQVTNPVDALVGKVSGVQLYNPSGQPGQSSTSINIRGISSINAGTQPLIIVDGAPFEGDLNTISNQDIESMTVLKDAASAALYGARGANGVILITTKSAKKGQATITLDAKWGSNSRAIPSYHTVDSPAKYYEMWYAGLNNYAQNQLGYSADMAAKFANQHLTDASNYGLGYNVYTVPQGEYMIGANGKLNPNATLGNLVTGVDGNQYYITPDDWTDATYNNGLRQEYTLTATGATDRSNFYGSLNYLSNEGITTNSDYERISARLKADYQLKPWLKLGGNFSYSHYDSNSLSEDGSSSSSGNVFALTQMAPIYPLYIRDAQGNIMFDNESGINMYDYGDGKVIGLSRPFMGQSNPLSDNQLNKNNIEGNTFSATGTAEVRLPFGFKITSVNTVSEDEARQTATINPFYGQYATQNGMVSKYHTRSWAYNLQQLINWTHDFGKHNVDVMLGHEYYRNHYYLLLGSKSNMFDPFGDELAGGVVAGTQESYTTDYNVEGWFGRAQYNYDQKYFGSISYRRDASSRFHPDHRWGNFWSFGGAWIISKESWFNAPWIDELKIKASYGEQGNDNIGDYLYTNSYTIVNSNDQISVVPYIYGNEDITWEKNGNFNAGVEFSLFRGRLSGSVEYFYRKTSDMLFSFPIAPSFGYRSYYRNVGDMRNQGVEIELSGDIIRTRDLTWSANLNMTAYNNKITRLPESSRTMTVDGSAGYSSSSWFFGEGESMYTWYMPQYAGVYYDESNPNNPDNGKAAYWMDVTDAEGNVIGREKTVDYSEADYHLCGTALPDVYGGFGTSLNWKGLEVSVNFSYQIGGKVYDSTYAQEMAFTRGNAFHTDLLDAWTPENTGSNIPRLQYNDDYTASTSDRFLTDASYLCLQNFSVAYNLPKNWVSRIGLGNVRVYVTGDNLWTWSKRQGLDPRQSISGSITSAYYAPMRTISGGLSITF